MTEPDAEHEALNGRGRPVVVPRSFRHVPRPVILARTVEREARLAGVTPADVMGPSRKQRFAVPRHAVWRQLRELYGWSFPVIARLVERDHSTVVHGVKPRGLRHG